MVKKKTYLKYKNSIQCIRIDYVCAASKQV